MYWVSSEFMPYSKPERAKIIYYADIAESKTTSSFYEIYFLKSPHYTATDDRILGEALRKIQPYQSMPAYTAAETEILGNSYITSYETIMQHFDELSLHATEGCDVVNYVLKKITDLLNQAKKYLKIRLDVLYLARGGGVRQDFTAYCIIESLCRLIPLELNPKPHYETYSNKINFGFNDFDNVIRGFMTKKKMIKMLTEKLQDEKKKEDIYLMVEELFSSKIEQNMRYSELDFKYLKMLEPVILIV